MGNKPWSDREINFLKDNSEKSILDIQKTIKRTKRAIQHKFNHLGIPRPKLKFNRDYFKIWSHNMAYILGFTMADGCISDEGRLRYGVKSTDISIINFIAEEINLDKKYIKLYSRLDKRTGNTYTSANLKFTISDNQHLKDLGIIPRKTGKEIIPPEIPKKYFNSFILGVFDGDGWVHKITDNRLAIGICCASEEYLNNIQNVFNFGYVVPKDNIYVWRTTKQEDIKRFYNKIYSNNCDFNLKRKREKFEDVYNG